MRVFYEGLNSVTSNHRARPDGDHVPSALFADLAARLQSVELLSLTAIQWVNDWLVERADHYRFVPRWRSLRLVAADASTVRFGLRASHVKRAYAHTALKPLLPALN